MCESYYPLRWESTNDQWWYASPIDWAAANGHYDLVRELLYLDTNHLIKLTSLRRIKRLETLWDDDDRFINAAKGRAFVARNLFMECERKKHKNSLIRAGYGGWLLYTASSAGDVEFVKVLLGRDSLFVFGEGEYGVTDILYAGARSKNSDVFRLLFDCGMKPKCLVGEIEEEGKSNSGNIMVFREEMMNRAVHAAARGGNLEILKELLCKEALDVLKYRDVNGSTILHAASGRGQLEIVKYIISSYDITTTKDNQGNIPLHIAAFRGHLSIVEALVHASPNSASMQNNVGDTFLHMAVMGFRARGFQRLDRHMDLTRHLINGSSINTKEIINIQNKEGRTPLHISLIGNMNSNLVELLMTAPSIDLNVKDVNGMTPLDLLKQRPSCASSEILMKKIVGGGGFLSGKDKFKTYKSLTTTHCKMPTSPGTSFKVSDSEIILYMGIEASERSGRLSSCSSSAKSEVDAPVSSNVKQQHSVHRATKKLKFLLRWPHKKEKLKIKEDDQSIESIKSINTPAPLRERYTKSSLFNNKRTLAVRYSTPRPSTKKKISAGLKHGVIQAMPHLAPNTVKSKKGKEVFVEEVGDSASCSNSSVKCSSSNRPSFANNKLVNQYLCFGAQGIEVEDSVSGKSFNRLFKRSALSVA